MSPWKRATLVEKGRPEAGSTGSTGTPPASSASWYALDKRRGLPVAVEPGNNKRAQKHPDTSYKVHLNPSADAVDSCSMSGLPCRQCAIPRLKPKERVL